MDDLTSPGAQLAERVALEEEWLRQIEPEVTGFLDRMIVLAMAGAGLSVVDSLGAWSSTVERLRKKLKLPSDVVELLRDSELPLLVSQAASEEIADSIIEKWSRKVLKRRLRARLGVYIAATVNGTLGTVTVAGVSFNWEAMVRRIARTESTRRFSHEVLAALDEQGFPYKRWSTRFDDRVRPTHQHADRQTVLLDEPFQVGDELLRFPGDELGSPAEVFNCRCVLVGVKFSPSGVVPNWDWTLVASGK